MYALSYAIALALHLAAASLHGYLAQRFWPDHKRSVQQQGMFWVMAGCAAFHGLMGLQFIAFLLELPQFKDPIVLAADIIGVLICAECVPSFLSEYTVLPKNPNRLARLFHRFTSRATHYRSGVLGLAGALGLTMVLLELGGGQERYPILQWLQPHYLVALLLVSWLAIQWSGLRPAGHVLAFMRGSVPWYLWGVFSCMLLLILAEAYALQPVLTTIARFATVPVAIVFAWYQHRLELIDVVAKHFAHLAVVVVGVAIGWTWIPKIPDSLQPATVLLIAVAGLYLVLRIDTRLSRLWMPGEVTREVFSRTFPRELSRCVDKELCIAYCEEALSTFFETEVGVNRSIDDPIEVLELEDEPRVRIELGRIKALYPWFSEALQLVHDAAQSLRGHLQVLELQQEQHRQTMNNQELSELAARAELQAMRAQIRPHFLFNVLNTIHSFIRDNPERAEKTIELLADLMRGVVESSSLDRYPLRRELELAETYLEIEKIRFGDRLSYEVVVDPEWLDESVPPFGIQPLVENAVKFSVDGQLGNAVVKVEVVEENGSIDIRVTDNGPGPGGAEKGTRKGLGIALENIRERLEKLYGDRASLSLEAIPEGGTMAILRIPVQSM
jgi:signal transduction histidine kinase